jgi:hypothetical protein
VAITTAYLEIGINLSGHLEHAPRNLLVRIGIAGEISTLAESAVDAESYIKTLHGPSDLSRFENLQTRILRRLLLPNPVGQYVPVGIVLRLELSASAVKDITSGQR